MAKPPYKITKKDYHYARQYIEHAMQRGMIDHAHGYTLFRNAKSPEQLQVWCDDYLSDEIFKRLKMLSGLHENVLVITEHHKKRSVSTWIT
jgi:hypothetical protein